MSFSVETEPHSGDAIRSAVEAIEPGAHIGDGNLRLLRYGKQLAITALDSGELGTTEGDNYFRVGINGHGAEAEPLIGDVLTVSISQVPAPE